jgi:hypothetical protein
MEDGGMAAETERRRNIGGAEMFGHNEKERNSKRNQDKTIINRSVEYIDRSV